MSALFTQAVLAFLLLPGIVAFVVPLAFVAPSDRRMVDAAGIFPVALGIFLLLWCVREFYVAGRGTLAPWAPPRHLVVSGLYQFSRNPMYVAVLLILLGWAVMFRSGPLLAYASIVGVAFVVRAVLFEEPFLARTHGEQWENYKNRVPRWFGRRHAA